MCLHDPYAVVSARPVSHGACQPCSGAPEMFSDLKDILCHEGPQHDVSGPESQHYVNGVAKKHGEVSSSCRGLCDRLPSRMESMQPHGRATLFRISMTSTFRGGRKTTSAFVCLSIPRQEIWKAHVQAKKELIRTVNRDTNAGWSGCADPGFARRAATYKRGDLLFTDIDRLKTSVKTVGPFQVIFGGKAHPRDKGQGDHQANLSDEKSVLKHDIRIAYLENYDMELGKIITSGVDVWLNTPQRPYEASGTSGMKAALNGVPSLSVLRWMVDLKHIEGITGWSIGENEGRKDEGHDPSQDATFLYQKLEHV